MTRPVETNADLARSEEARVAREGAAIRYQNQQARPAGPHPLSRLSDLVAELSLIDAKLSKIEADMAAAKENR